jgi:hypothetical protein
MSLGNQHDAVRQVVIDYLEGMLWGDEERLRRAFHPGALQVGHFDGSFEFFPLPEFLAWLKDEGADPPGTSYTANLLSIEVTGTVAVAKITDTCFGTDFTDYLVMVNDKPDASGRWQIVTKAYHAHSGRGRGQTAT